MKRILLIPAMLLVALALFANPAPQNQSAQGGMDLEKVLNAMDRTAQSFTSAQADLVSETYQSVVNETDTQKGVMYVRKTPKGLDSAVEINYPPGEQKHVLVSNGVAQLYQPRIDQITKYNLGKNREAFESFLVLGFGGRGHDLAQQFDMRYGGMEKVNGVNTAKLELTPKSARVRGMFDRIILWIDPAMGVSVQQQFFEPASGNYRLAKYGNIKLNKEIPPGVFKLKTTGKTKMVTAQ
jgi:outer membrane lipoprotein-sorting protein